MQFHNLYCLSVNRITYTIHISYAAYSFFFSMDNSVLYKNLNFQDIYIYKTNILIYLYVQQDATLRSLFYLETALHVVGGTNTHY
jgi:hypothetical protein